MLQNFSDPQSINVNEFINGTIIAIDYSKDVQKEFKALIDTIKDKLQENYQSVYENILYHLSNFALQDQNRQEKNKDAISICIEILQSCLQTQYFAKSANALEFLQISLTLSQNAQFTQIIKNLFQHFNSLINLRQANIKSAVNALDKDMKAQYHQLIGIPPSPRSGSNKFEAGNRYCTLSGKSTSLISPSSDLTIESQIEKECQNIANQLKVEIPPEKPVAMDTPSPPETRYQQVPVPSQYNQQDIIMVSMDNIPAVSGGLPRQDQLQVPQMSTVKSVQNITQKDARRGKYSRGSQKSQAGSPDRSSIVKQEIDCFSSDVEGTAPEGDNTLIVNELDTSAIVDPNKMQVIGYENGKQSIAVPETRKNEGESSNFEEEEFDNDNLQINEDLTKNGEVQMEFGKSEAEVSKTSRKLKNEEYNLQDLKGRKFDSAAVLTEQEKQQLMKQQEDGLLKNKYITDEEELTQFNITESNQSHEENARNSSSGHLTLQQQKQSLQVSESIQSDSQTQIQTNPTAQFQNFPQSSSILNSVVSDGTQRYSQDNKSEMIILSVFEEISTYQTQIKSLDSLTDLDMLLPEIFNSLRENYDQEKDGSQFINDFYNLLLLNEILLHQDSESVKDNLSMLIDEMAESKKKIPEPIVEDFNTQILYQILSTQSVIQVEDILEVLNLKMLNVSHPFLEEIIQFCAVIFIMIKDGGAEEADNIKKCHVLTDSLVNWSQNNKDQNIKNAALECVHLLQDLQASLGNQ